MNALATPASLAATIRRRVPSSVLHVPSARVVNEIVTCCAQTKIPAVQRERVQVMARRRTVSWSAVLDLAASHGVQPLVGRNLKQLVPAHLPASVRKRIDDYARIASIHNVFLVKELGRLQCWFEEQGIPSLALKGPVVAKVAYGDIHLRRYSDIDLLIPPAHFAAAERMLLQGDYTHFQKLEKVTGLRKHLYLYLSQQWPFKRGNGIFTLDLHTRVMPPGYRYPVGFDALKERAQKVNLGAVETDGCAPEDMLHLLCFHGIKNQWRALKYVCDMAELIEARPNMDWDAVVARAEQGGFAHVLRLGLCLVHETFSVELPPEVLAYVTADQAVCSAADKLVHVMAARGEGRVLSYRERVQILFVVLHSLPNKVRYATYSALRNIWSTLFQFN